MYRPSPYQLFNLQPYSTNEETSLSLQCVHYKLLAPVLAPFYPSPLEGVTSTKSHAGLTTYNFHPPFRIGNK